MWDNRIYYPKVGKAFSFYEAFKAQNKIATSCPVTLKQPRPNREYEGSSPVKMAWADFHCTFEATKSPKLLLKYDLKLFANEFDGKPCFRFKSRGTDHFNIETGEGLLKRVVECPHFYRVDSRGVLEAYRTPPLNDPAEAERIKSDPQIGTNYFCQEANLYSPTGCAILLKIEVDGLGLPAADPLADATFPTQ